MHETIGQGAKALANPKLLVARANVRQHGVYCGQCLGDLEGALGDLGGVLTGFGGILEGSWGILEWSWGVSARLGGALACR